MKNVIPFPRTSARKPEIALANQASGRAHVAIIRNAVENAPRMNLSDRRRVAENMWNIFTTTKKQGVKTARILQLADQGNPEESTKRLPRFAMNPSLPDPEKEKRSKYLAQDPKKYLKIADVAGKEAYGDADRFIKELFAGTSVIRKAALHNDVDDIDIYTELADIIRDLSRALVGRHGLASVFRDIADYRLCRWVKDGSLFPAQDDWAALWANFADGVRVIGIDDLVSECASGESQYWTDNWLLPYPNLRIGWGSVLDGGRWPESRSPATRMRFTASPIDKTDSPPWTTHMDGTTGRELITDKSGKPVTALGQIIAEVRLALLPVGEGIEPVFITRLWTQVDLSQLKSVHDEINPDDELPNYVTWPWLPSDWVGAGSLDNWNVKLYSTPDHEQHEALSADLIGREPALVAQFTGDNGRYDGEGGVRIDLVSATSCRAALQLHDWDDYPCTSDAESIMERPELRDHDRVEAHICRSRELTLARAVEENLFLGRSEYRLDTLLDHVCGRVAANVSEFLQPFKAVRRAKRDEITKLWEHDNPT